MKEPNAQEQIKQLADWLNTKEPYRSGMGDAAVDAEDAYILAVNDPMTAAVLRLEQAQENTALRRRMHALSAIAGNPGIFDGPVIPLATAQWILGRISPNCAEFEEAFTLLKQVLATSPLNPDAYGKLTREIKDLIERVEGGTSK